jgi:hypothetical protein
VEIKSRVDRACCRGARSFIFASEYRASSCWYLCWYRQQSTIKVVSNSNGYGSRQLSARGTKMKTSIITRTYDDGSIPDFRENSQRTLKTRVKIRPSRACCRYFCRYLGEQPFAANIVIPSD